MRLAMIRFFSKIAGPVFYSRESALVFLFFHEFAGPASFIQLVFLFERKEYITMYVNYVKIRVVVVIE